MKIISLLNFKGGVGKTTSTHSIGAALSNFGKKILLIDLDPQGTLTFLSTDKNIENSSTELLFHKITPEECILKETEFDIIPSSIKLATSELELNGHYGKEFKLKTALESLKDSYDYILIDCPPSLSVFTLNALTASTDLIIPCECELASLEGLELLLATLGTPIKALNPDLKILGILPTKLDGRKNISREVYETLQEEHKNLLPPIRINSKLSELGIEKVSIFKYDKNSNGAKDYFKVAQVILDVKA
ncbi:ParA family protein [Cetobacterium sp. 2A]|uniref:ParA family protein n=1 Tax=unclassified Cetobacterium TaxID=2630983 RepID=UPI00163C9246|nr:ParA family protein [Cetobacterium sp. 2A]MBC2857383.1 ParA family protein [Cetobacterium sp. 2A]